MGSTIIVDTAWNEGYSAIVIIPVAEDYNGWSGTITFSHPVLSVTVSLLCSVCLFASFRPSFCLSYQFNSLCQIVITFEILELVLRPVPND